MVGFVVVVGGGGGGGVAVGVAGVVVVGCGGVVRWLFVCCGCRCRLWSWCCWWC